LEKKQIAEIGGGDSRLLPVLAEKNYCYNIEEFKGVGQGPIQEISFQGVTNIHALVGDSHGSINNDEFDVIFSVSVIEHVPDDKLTDFFVDCHRILKPGGLMIHLIDIYLEDDHFGNTNVAKRIMLYRSFLDEKLFSPLSNPEINTEMDVRFSTKYATNPDNVMNVWNRVVPQLKNKREISQSCSLLMGCRSMSQTVQANQ
jgi:SAM-dependent methyltransferase